MYVHCKEYSKNTTSWTVIHDPQNIKKHHIEDSDEDNDVNETCFLIKK
jgi:hypothetical protein